MYKVEPRAESTAMYQMVTLEEILDKSTDIVKATCLGFVKANDDTTVDVLFSVDKRFRGEDTGKLIYVNQPTWRCSDSDFVMSPPQYHYEVGESYYLLMIKMMSVFEDYEYYVDEYGVFFAPANKMQEALINNESLSKYLKIDSDKLEETLLAYIEQSKAPDYTYDASFYYIKSTDRKEILNASDYIVSVKLSENIYKFSNKWRYECIVTEVLKGDLKRYVRYNDAE